MIARFRSINVKLPASLALVVVVYKDCSMLLSCNGGGDAFKFYWVQCTKIVLNRSAEDRTDQQSGRVVG